MIHLKVTLTLGLFIQQVHHQVQQLLPPVWPGRMVTLFLRAGTLSGDDLIDSFKVKHVADCSLLDLDTFSSIEAERFDNFKVVHDELTVRSGVNTTSFPTATWHYNINKVLGNVGADVEDTPPGSIQIGGTGSFLISTTDNFGRDRTAELAKL